MMEELKLKLLFVCALIFLMGAAPVALGGDYVNPGMNYWTCPDANIVFGGGGGGGCMSPVPADFFGPGSDPFDGTVACKGEDPVSDATTERTTQGHVPPPYPSSDTVELELIELALVSVAPITITYNGGMDPELWDVEVDLSAISPPPGTLNATKTHGNGGTYTSEVYVQPRFTFTKVDDPCTARVLDTGLEGLETIDLNSVGPCPWEHSPDGNDFRPSAVCPMKLADDAGCSMTLIPAPKMTDSFWVQVGPDGVAEGGGSGYNGGSWYYYPNTNWWNEWFYDHPYDPNRMKVIDVNFTIRPLDPGLPSWATVAYDWSTPDWPDPCNPPLPPLDPCDEDLYIQRSVFFESDLQLWPQVVQNHFEIPDYNPEWISIDVNGFNFEIIDGWIDHACLPKDGEPCEPKPPVEHLKWSQPPIEIDPTMDEPLYCGWDVESFTYDPCNWWNLVADDFRCLGTMPVTSIHWWGSYIEWDGPNAPEPNVLIAWRIGFWSNVPAGLNADYSYPEVLLWQIEVDANRVDEQWVGMDLAPWPDPWPESCFQYYVDLEPEEYFRQGDFTDDTNDNVFWISIAAIYEDTPFEYAWGWKTRPWHWMDDAVEFYIDGDPQPGMVLDPVDIGPIEDWYTGESYDAAFELDTDPNYIKWEQAFTGIRNWPHYEDVPSWAEMWDEGPAHLVVAADDWPCDDELPVTAIVWWGSYLGYEYEACADPCMPPPEQPAYFWISIWTDVPDPDPNDPASWSQPDKKIWEYHAYDYDEVLVGSDKYPHDASGVPIPGPREPVFRYSVRLPEDEWFWQDANEAVYWISIVAVYEEHYPPYEWGWTNHEHVFNDDAVEGWPLDLYDLEGEWEWWELYDQTGLTEDLSFVLFTEPEAQQPEPCEPKPPVPHLKWSQPPIEIDPDIYETPTYCGWNEPSHTEIVSFTCWGPTWPYQCHGDADNAAEGKMALRVSTNDLNILRAAMGGSYPNPPYNACADFDRDLVVGPSDVNILQEWYNNPAVPPDCLPWVAGTPATGDTEYWDLFAVSLSPSDVYWNLVDGGAGVLSDPLVSPDPDGSSVIDSATPLGGVAWGFGGSAWGDGILDSNAGAYSIQLMGEPDYYLSVVLDTSTLPQRDTTFPSWGIISDIVVTPWNAGAWGAPIEPNWAISPFDPDSGTAVTPNSVTLASNDFGANEMLSSQSMGIWGAAAELPPADGYKVDFEPNVSTWDSYDGVGPEPPEISWYMVADDFRCLGPMPITSIHWWGSYLGWEDSEPPEIEPEAWRIGFWSNVPAGLNADYSYPEKLLWQIEVRAPRVEAQYVGQDYFPDLSAESCFQYHVELIPEEYFWQDEFDADTIDHTFWLSITAVYPIGSPAYFPWGWKTRPWSWMDDAVRFELNEAPEPGMVLDLLLIEPIEDPIYGESYDVAFELDTDPNFIKWEQAYDSIRHWPHYEDELSMAIVEAPAEPNIIRLVADDWPCDTNTPITAAVWWGSYIGYGYQACNMVGPWMDLPVKPNYFWLTIWDDVPAGVDPNMPYSHPNNIIWEYWAYDYDEVLVGYDKHPYGEPNEPVFRYSVRLPDANWFRQDANDGIYWFSVVAVYDQNIPNYDWGWTNHKHMYNDDAVAGTLVGAAAPVWDWVKLEDQTGESEDMSFVLFTACFPSAHPGNAQWLLVGKPHCWCYLRQCHGDADDLPEGKNNYWVAVNDLTILKNAWAKPLGLLVGNEICADFDHASEGKNKYRVAVNDLTILKNNWAIPNGPDPNCFAGY